MLRLECFSESVGGHKHDPWSEVWPAAFDAAIQRAAAYPGHSHVADNDVVAASGEQFECLSPMLRSLDVVALRLVLSLSVVAALFPELF